MKRTGVLEEEVEEYSAAHKAEKAKAIAETKAKQARDKVANAAKKKAAMKAAKQALAAQKARKARWA